jgi:small nuclear ribonucleoprotein (snRNP)-like protein
MHAVRALALNELFAPPMNDATTTNDDKVVLVLDDDTRLKGIVDRFDPNRSRIDLREVDLTGHQVERHDVDMKEILVAFVVRDLAVWRSKPLTEEDLPPEPEQEPPPMESGDAVRVTLRWGETMEGVIPDHDPRRPWFWFYPFTASSRSGNVERVYITRRGVGRMEPASMR